VAHKHPVRWTVTGVSLTIPLLLAACGSPVQPLGSEELRDSIMTTTMRELAEANEWPQSRELSREESDVASALSAERRRELAELSGRESYLERELPIGEDLYGQESDAVGVTLRQAITSAIENNLDIRSAKLGPALAEADVVRAEAAFDATFFTNYSLNWVDDPQVQTVTGAGLSGSRSNTASVRTLETGIRKALSTGGAVQISTEFERTDNDSPGFDFTPDPSYATNLLLQFNQPLLRNFGSDVNLAEIRVTRNQSRNEIETLRSQMISLVNQVEQSYWTLKQARWNLRIRQRLLDRGIETRDVLKGRLDFDVTPAEWSDAIARVESRKADVITAKSLVRQASDQLKLLINHPDLPVGTETMILPVDRVVDLPIEYSLLDAITTGLEHRPEVQRAIINMDNASIQVMLANNQRLPVLDLAASLRYNGLDDDLGDSYDELTDADYIEYLVALQFEYPIGNRAAEAQYRRSQLQRSQATLTYQSVVRQVVLDVKTAVRDLDTNYRLVGQRNSARLAAAENLRTLQVQEEVQALTPEFLNLKFNRQEALAAAELNEVNALVQYNVSLASFYAAMGIALERNQIDFVVPELGD
jgi:outer membrane protein